MLLDDVVYSASLFVAACVAGMKMKTGAHHGQRFSHERLPLARKPNLISIQFASNSWCFQAPLCPSTHSSGNRETRWNARITITIHSMNPLEFGWDIVGECMQSTLSPPESSVAYDDILILVSCNWNMSICSVFLFQNRTLLH